METEKIEEIEEEEEPLHGSRAATERVSIYLVWWGSDGTWTIHTSKEGIQLFYAVDGSVADPRHEEDLRVWRFSLEEGLHASIGETPEESDLCEGDEMGFYDVFGLDVSEDDENIGEAK